MFGSRTRYTEEEIQAIEEAMEESNPGKWSWRICPTSYSLPRWPPPP
jgi:hypothetical protein